MNASLRMLDLPKDGEGLAWIARNHPAKLLTIPGVTALTITAAAAGDEASVLNLRSTAQQHAAIGMGLQRHVSDSLYHAASHKGTDWATWQRRLRLDDGLKLLIRHRQQHADDLMSAAASGGHLAALQWLLAICQRSNGILNILMSQAASAGQLSVMEWLHTGPYHVVLDQSLMIAALEQPHCLKWLLSQEPPCRIHHRLACWLIELDQLDMLAWLHSKHGNNSDLWEDAVQTAVTYERLQILQWLGAQKVPGPPDNRCILQAARVDNLEMLKWMWEQKWPWDQVCTATAIRLGGPSTQKWIQDRNLPGLWGYECSLAAAATGNFVLLERMQKRCMPCPWTVEATDQAAALKSADMIKWLHQHGCPLRIETVCCAAARGNSAEVLLWLHALCRAKSCQLSIVGAHLTHRINTPNLMLLGDLDCRLDEQCSARLTIARQSFCAFHGLLRWARKATSDPFRGAHRAFNTDSFLADTSGQELLAHLCLLPKELISKIAFMAELQHEVALNSIHTTVTEQHN